MSIMGGDAGETDVYLYAKVNGETVGTVPLGITGYNNWDTKTLGGITVPEGGILTVGIYARNTQDKDIARIEQQIRSITSSKEGVLQTHGLYIDRDEHIVNFDIIVDFAIKDPITLRNKVLQEVQALLPDYRISINIDRDITD